MEICLNNPFRILGLTATANEREITKRVSDLIIYAEMQKQKNYDLDLGFLKPITRTPETIQEAKKKIEQVEERLFNSLFWLWNNSSVDQLAFDFLKESDITKAIEILKKGTKENVNVKNYTSHINLSVLYLLQYRSNGTLNKEALKNALTIIGNLFSSSIFLSIISKEMHYADNDTVDRMVTRFINIFLAETEKDLTPSEVMSLLSYFDDNYKEIAIRKFTSKQIDDIENEVELTKNKRLKDAAKTNKYGNLLYTKVKKDLTYLESILTRSSIQYEMIADKVAEEILLCSFAFFNHYRENIEFDPGEETIKLMNLVQEIGIGASIKKRINDNLPTIKEWIENKPERDAYLKCWYCGVEMPDKNRVIKVPMHLVLKDKYVSFFDSPYLPKTIRYKYFDVEINRCAKCYERQENSNGMGYSVIIGVCALFASIAILNQFIDNTEAVSWISVIIAVVGGFISYNILKSKVEKKFGTIKHKSKSDYYTHPIIQELKSEGWEFGSKPPNVQ
ncbi:MAG: hypothetical protein Q8M94_17525 [Ignavibacteria bacterium]|nr:hypothetical protein [Ignavibacteria bacterium]